MTLGFEGGGFPPSENNILQSFSDATAGRSLFLYWCVATTAGTTVDYVLARDSGLSTPVSTTGVADSTVVKDFDITINKSTLFAGIGYLDIKVQCTAGGTNNVQARIYHYDGSETLISTAPSTANLGVEITPYKMPLTITRKAFKPGDILRLKLSIVTHAGSSVKVFHDPNTAGDELKLWVPVVNLE